jgi:hypothetical protein
VTSGPDVVFLGPTLPWAEAREIVPDAVLLPPASMGDVLAACRAYQPHSIGIVDGYFLSRMSVFHKEIVYALSEGVWVLGASSMGALRAAECDDFGMIGVGGIYRDLASGALEDDDEVALNHADEASGFRPLSDPMVTIRATLGAALDEGLLTVDEHDELVGRQKERWFPDRRLSSVRADAISLGFDDQRARTLVRWLVSHVVDPKRADALELLHHVRSLPQGPMPPEDRPELVRSAVFRATLARDVIVSTPDGWAVTLDRIRRYAALHDDEYDDVMRATRRTNALVTLSALICGPVTPEEVESARHQLARAMGIEEGELSAHLRAADMDDAGIGEMIAREAHVLRMERSFLGRTKLGMVTAGFLCELRKRGRYDELKAAAALQYALAEGVSLNPPPTPTAIARTHMGVTGWRLPGTWEEYVDAEELGSIPEVIDAMLVSVKAHHALFGTGILDDDGTETILFAHEEPMMSRGR